MSRTWCWAGLAAGGVALIPVCSALLIIGGSVWAYAFAPAAVAVAWTLVTSRRPEVSLAGSGAIAGLAALLTNAGITAGPVMARPYTQTEFGSALYGADAPRAYGEYFEGLLVANPTSQGWPLMVLLLMAVLFAVGASWLALLALRQLPGRTRIPPRALLGGLVSALAFLLVVTGFSTSEYPAGYYENPPEEYRFDVSIYGQTFFLMKQGQGFYEAFVNAAAADKLIIENEYVRDGRFYGWAETPLQIREPWVFYLWVAFDKVGIRPYVLLLLLGGVAMGLACWGLWRFVGSAASIAPLLMAPYVQSNPAALGTYLPDAWAGLAIAISLSFWMRRRFVTAGVFAMLAGAFREPALLLLASYLLWAIYKAIRRSEGWRATALWLGGLLGVFGVLLGMHSASSARIIAKASSSTSVIQTLFSNSASRGLLEKLYKPYIHQQHVWLLIFVPPLVFAVLHLLGYWFALKPDRDVQVPVFGHAAAWVAFLGVIGAPSGYWGQYFALSALMGSAAFVAWVLAMSAAGLSAATAPAKRTARQGRL